MEMRDETTIFNIHNNQFRLYPRLVQAKFLCNDFPVRLHISISQIQAPVQAYNKRNLLQILSRKLRM
jgi:hypothetical protein